MESGGRGSTNQRGRRRWRSGEAASPRLPEVFAPGDRDRAGQRQIEVVGLTKGQESRDGEAKALIESLGNHDGLSQHRASEQARSCAAKTLAATR